MRAALPWVQLCECVAYVWASGAFLPVGQTLRLVPTGCLRTHTLANLNPRHRWAYLAPSLRLRRSCGRRPGRMHACGQLASKNGTTNRRTESADD